MRILFLAVVICFILSPVYSQVVMYPTSRVGSNNIYFERQNVRTMTTYNFKVVTTDGKIESIKSAILYDKKTDSYYLKEKRRKIFANQTTKIFLTSKKDTLTGISKGDKWIFPLSKGIISTYSVYPYTKKRKASYIQKVGNDELYKFNRKFKKATLPALVSDNLEALKAYQKYKSSRDIVITCKIVLPIPFLFIRCPSSLKVIDVYNQASQNKLSKK